VHPQTSALGPADKICVKGIAPIAKLMSKVPGIPRIYFSIVWIIKEKNIRTE
tara:strand:+ start:908 stop:1063 length:156 start_codon:yes stop_codon:yes gene_type:complete